MRIVFAVLSYNRFEYLEQCLRSLGRSDTRGCRLLLVDDASSDPRVRDLLRSFSLPGVPVDRLFLRFRRGHPNRTARIALNHFTKQCRDFDLWGIVDNDMVFAADWLPYMTAQIHMARRRNLPVKLFSAFNASGVADDGGGAPVEEVIAHDRGAFGIKPAVGGAHLFFEPVLVDELGPWKTRRRGPGWDRQWSRKCRERGYKALVTIPSKVQHIGAVGLHSQGGQWDRAGDFEGGEFS